MAITQISKIQNKRGEMDPDRTGLPVLSPGELGYATNQNRLFVGNEGASGPMDNTEVLTQASLGPTLNYNPTTGKVNAIGSGGGGTGTTYNISAETTTGGALLSLNGSDSTVDSVKFASTGSITIARTSDSTITIGGGGTVGGSDKSIQYNNLGVLSGTSTFLFDSTSTVLTIGSTASTGTLIIDGSSATISSSGTDSSVRINPQGIGSLLVGPESADSIVESVNSLLVVAATTLTLQAQSSDINLLLSSNTANKVSISGPTAIQYATGLADNDLVNKYYVDNNGGGGGSSTLTINIQNSDYTTVIGDAQAIVVLDTPVASTTTFLIDNSLAYNTGTAISFVNDSTDTLKINVTSGNLVQAQSGLGGERELQAYGMATAIKLKTNYWFINGAGLV